MILEMINDVRQIKELKVRKKNTCPGLVQGMPESSGEAREAGSRMITYIITWRTRIPKHYDDI